MPQTALLYSARLLLALYGMERGMERYFGITPRDQEDLLSRFKR